MIELKPISEASLIDPRQNMIFETSNWAKITSIPCGDSKGIVHLQIGEDYAWTREDLKELIAFLKCLRKKLPKEYE